MLLIVGLRVKIFDLAISKSTIEPKPTTVDAKACCHDNGENRNSSDTLGTYIIKIRASAHRTQTPTNALLILEMYLEINFLPDL